jgi:D-alanyl-D-alanine carboxypeptidase
MNSELQTFLDDQRVKYNLPGLIMAISYKNHGKVYVSGRSMTTVPVEKCMNYRIGGQGIPILTTLFLILVDHGYFNLNDKIGSYLPKVPNGKFITLQMLCNMTSGLEDVINNPEVANSIGTDVFREWTDEELLNIVYNSKPLYIPGERFYFGHITNMLLLCTAIKMVTKTTIKDLIKHYIIEPLNLESTQYEDSQNIKEPVLHSFANNRVPYSIVSNQKAHSTLSVNLNKPSYYEDSTYWNGSWGSYATKINSNAYDVNVIARSIGSGKLISNELYQIQLSNPGQPSNEWYGMGFVVGGFNLNTKIIWTNENFGGYLGIWCYIPIMKIAINIQTNAYNNDDFKIDTILDNLFKTFTFEYLKQTFIF